MENTVSALKVEKDRTEVYYQIYGLRKGQWEHVSKFRGAIPAMGAADGGSHLTFVGANAEARRLAKSIGVPVQ